MSLVDDATQQRGMEFFKKMDEEIDPPDNSPINSPIRELITDNLTVKDIYFKETFDKLTYEKQQNYIKTLPLATREDINAKKKFTDDFLELVNDYIETYIELEKNDKNYYDGIFIPITNLFKRLAGNYGQEYKASNRLYFLFLANVYCHSNEYYPKYKWLKELLEMFEGLGLTGLFDISPPDYIKLFNGCNKLHVPLHTESRVIKDKTIISNTTIVELIKNSDICRFGDNCTRLNVEHRIKYHSYVPPAASAIHTVKKIKGAPGSILKVAPSYSRIERGGKKTRQNKLRPKKTHKKRQIKHKKRHNKSKKLI